MARNNGNEDLRIGVYVCHCGSNIAGVIDPAVVAEYASTMPGGVLYVQAHRSSVTLNPRAADFMARSPNSGCFWRQSGTLAPQV